MYDQYTWVFALSVIVAFFAAFGIGANDVVSGTLFLPQLDLHKCPCTSSADITTLKISTAGRLIVALMPKICTFDAQANSFASSVGAKALTVSWPICAIA